MAIDCDARAFGIQTVCSYPLGADFRLDVHITKPPRSGYWGFQAKVSWDDPWLSYQPRPRSRDEVLSDECVVLARTHYPYDPDDKANPSEPPYVLFACIPFPLPDEGLTTTGPVLRFTFRCIQDGLPNLRLVSSNDDAQLGTHFLSGTLPVDPLLTPAQVVCGTGGTTDTDGDGCTDGTELSSAAPLGGQRDPLDYWDFYDTPDGSKTRDKVVSAGDISRVVQRFGGTGDASASPLSTPPDSGYHPSFDRGGRAGAHTWNQAPANGSVTAADVAAAAGQLGHSCA